MKKMLTLILAAALCLSMAACGSEPSDTSEPDSQSSSSSQDVGQEESEGEDASLEVVEGEGDEPEEDENVSKLDTEEPTSEPEASQEAESSSQASAPASSAGGQSGGQSTSSQAPASQPEEQPDEQPVENEPEEEPVSQKPTQPVTQPSSQSQAPAASSQDDPTAWTQEKVDAVVEAYRQAALDRGWEEDTSLDIHGNGSWGNPIDTRNARYDVLTNSANIEEYLYGREYAVDRSPEEMYFNLYVEDEGDYWTIYFIFAYDM